MVTTNLSGPSQHMDDPIHILALEMEARRLRDALARIECIADNLGFAGEEIRNFAHVTLENSEVAARDMHHLTQDAEDLLEEVCAALSSILPQNMDHEIDEHDHLLIHRIEDCLKELARRGVHRRRQKGTA